MRASPHAFQHFAGVFIRERGMRTTQRGHDVLFRIAIFQFKRETHACAYAQSACYFARQHSFRVSGASAPSYGFRREIKVLTRRGTLFIYRTKTLAFSARSTRCMCTPCKGTVLRACAIHVHAQTRSFFPTAQQQHTCRRHMSRICACDCVGKKNNSDAVRRTKS